MSTNPPAHRPRPARRAVLSALAVAPLVPLPVLATAQAPLRAERPLMGTQVQILVSHAGQRGAARLVDDAFARMAGLAAAMSRFDPGSHVSALNRAAGAHPVAVPATMMEVLQQAQSVHERTGGAFDVTVGRLTHAGVPRIPDPGEVQAALAHVGMRHLRLDRASGTAYIDDPMTQVDLGGIAKLPILEAGLEVLTAGGLRGVMLNGGGDVLASPRDDGRPWRIGVRDPQAPARLMAVVALPAGIVASSGDYERYVMHEGRRYHHVIDPATGRPTRGIPGVTLVAGRACEVNGLGAAAMVAGPARAAALLARCGVEQALFAREAGAPWISAAMLQRLEPAPA